MKYVLNQGLFKKRLSEMGFTSVSEFTKKTAINRNTLLSYLAGKNVFPTTFTQIAEELKSDPLEFLLAVSESSKIQNFDEISHIIAAIAKSDKKISVLLLGSRAKGSAKKYSDWDIGITCGESPLTTEKYLHIKNMVSELSEDIPRNVDIINLDSAPSWFLKEINYNPFFLDGNNESFAHFKGVLNGIKK